MAIRKGSGLADKLAGSNSADTMAGLGGNDTLSGLGGNDRLDGGVGDDLMQGGKGNDTYYVNSKNDRINEGSYRDKHDLIRSTISINLGTKSHGNGQVEDVLLLGSLAIGATGTNANNKLTGNGGVNVLKGNGGNDLLIGGGGADILIGGAGKDTLKGGGGNDLLIQDSPTFETLSGGSGIDTIRFTGGGDSINLNTGVGSVGRAARVVTVNATQIEIIDITGTGDNQLNLNRQSALQSDTDELTILGDAGDTVTLGFQFTPAGQEVIGGEIFDVFTSGSLKIFVPVVSTALLDGPKLNTAILDGFIGFQVDGTAASDKAGFSVSNAGDMNGDGFADYIVGGLYAGSMAGAAFVIFGTSNGMPSSFDLSTLDGSNGFRLDGVTPNDALGAAVASGGDINGDGFDDIVIGADYYGSYTTASYSLDVGHAAYVVFGKESGFGSSVDLAALDGTDGFRIDSTDFGDSAGRAVSGIGDINGDGFGDFILGAPYHDAGGAVTDNVGGAFIIFGQANFVSNFDLATLNGTNGFRLDGVGVYDYTGYSVSGAGDVNGDGFQDFMVSAHLTDYAGINSGSAYLIFGSGTAFAATIDLATINGSNGYRFNGVAADDRTGSSVDIIGDFNGDGFDDLLIGARTSDVGGLDSGAAYVVFGGDANLSSLDALDGSTDGQIDLSELDGSNGFRLDGVAADDSAGRAVTFAGDINGDGFDDLLIGASDTDNNGSYSGSAYLLFGGAGAFASIIDLSTLNGETGFRLDGAVPGYSLGFSVSSAGDLDGDGFDDIIVGALDASPNGSSSGTSYVIYGNDFRLEADQVATSGKEDLTGTGLDEILIGDAVANIITGGGGADAINAGSGNDTIIVSDRTFFRINGGGGEDTLKLDFNGVMNFDHIDGNPFGSGRNKIAGIEIIDVDNGFDNTLMLHKADVLDMDCQIVDIGLTSLDNILRIDGNVGDTLGLFTSDNWDAGDAGKLAGYVVYSSDNVQVAIDSDISVSFLPDPSTATELSTLDGIIGYRFDGHNGDDESGKSVSSAGDINGDGFDDLLIGAWRYDVGGDPEVGAAYVVFGGSANLAALDAKDGSVDGRIDLSELDGSSGFRLDGAELFDSAGSAVSSAGDLNADGFDDILVGAYFAGLFGFQAGATYVVFGSDTAFSPVINLSELDGTDGFKLDGVTVSDAAGNSVSAAGDVNGDGFGDFIFGVYGSDAGGTNSGAAYVVFGAAGGFPAALSLTEIDGTNGFRLTGAADNDMTGKSVSGAGDINGDGFDDLIVGGYEVDTDGTDSDTGAAYVVFGAATGFGAALDLSTLDGSNGFRLDGVAAKDNAGIAVSTGGDINGDGYDDMIVSAAFADLTGANSGVVYVVFGAAGGFASTIDLSTLDGSNGFRLVGENTSDQAGFSVSLAGDVNADGYDDLIIGAPVVDNGAGAAYIVFGAAGGFAASIDLPSLDGEIGYRLSAETADNNTANAVSAAGDLNGDGFDDVIVGAQGVDVGAAFQGASYVVYGSDVRTEVTELGTSGDDTITGSVSAEILVGAEGNDLISGEGGADVINGGSGDDSIDVSDANFFRIDGGGGLDTLELDFDGNIDFGNLDNDALTSDRGRISGIETIDVTNGHANDLTLHKADVLDIDCQIVDALGDATLDNVLVLDGEVGDTLALAASEGWTNGSTVAGHVIYFTDNVRIAVDTDIQVSVV